MTSNEEEGPIAKKLRSSEPDLCVIVGQDEKKKEYWYHCQVLASHSNYIDAMLATPMKESQTMEVSFPDLTPATWESMMGFLTNPVKARDMTVADAMKVAVGYDKYECPMGSDLCDRVFSEALIKNLALSRHEKKPEDDLNLLIDAYILADKVHLKKTKRSGKEYFMFALNFVGRFGRTMFTVSQMEKLVPLIAKHNLLDGEYRKEEILKPMFSKYLVATYRDWNTSRDLALAVPKLSLSGTGCTADGEFIRSGFDWSFRCNRKVRWNGVYLIIKIDMLEDDWVIYGETEPEVDQDGEEGYESVVDKVLWKSPFSENLALPPKRDWEPVDELARGNPKIEYIYSD